MSTTKHERPGVYSRYDASTVVSGGGSGKTVGIAALSEAEAGGLHALARYEDAAAAFGAEDNLCRLAQTLFRNGAAQVKAAPVAAEEGYEAAFALLEAEEDLAVIFCDSTTLGVQQKLRESVENASQARRERIAVVCPGSGENVSELVARAEALNSERVVLAAPADGTGGALAAAAAAGAIAGENDPAVPLGGA